MEPVVYMRPGEKIALVGPLYAWDAGARIAVVARAPRTLDGGDPGAPAFEGVVRRVTPDGLAVVMPEIEEEDA